MAPTMEKLANLLEFAVCFDKIKVKSSRLSLPTCTAQLPTEATSNAIFSSIQSSKPEIQNDLSYFRRMVAVSATSNQLERCGYSGN